MSTFLQLERYKLGLSAAEVVEFIGSSRATYTRWEAGAPIPSDKLDKLSELGFDIQYVVTGQRVYSENFNFNIHKEAIEIVATYISRSGRQLTHPELFYDVVMEIYELIVECENNEQEVDHIELGAKVIQLFAA